MTKPENGSGCVLVASASRFGTTAEVAEVVAESIRLRGMEADAKPIGDVTELTRYDAVVIGAPIHYDNWMSPARRFVTDNEAALGALPVAYFFTCGTLFESTDSNRAKAQQYADKLQNLSGQVTPVSIGQFGGVLDYSRMSLLTRLALRVPFALLGASEGDYRDLDAIRSWTQGLPFQQLGCLHELPSIHQASSPAMHIAGLADPLGPAHDASFCLPEAPPPASCTPS